MSSKLLNACCIAYNAAKRVVDRSCLIYAWIIEEGDSEFLDVVILSLQVLARE